MADPSDSRSYFWALHPEVSTTPLDGLSPEAEQGLDLAGRLAFNGLERSQDPRRNLRPAKLTIDDLANQMGLPPETIRHLIALARRRLFGALTDAGIRKRIQRQQGRDDRPCQQPGCTRLIAAAAPAHRRYCAGHRTPKARTRRHRQQRARTSTEGPTSAAPSSPPRLALHSGSARQRPPVDRESTSHLRGTAVLPPQGGADDHPGAGVRAF